MVLVPTHTAGYLLAAPTTASRLGCNAARPFLVSKSELMRIAYGYQTFGLGLDIFCVMWAIDWIEFELEPWGRMIGWKLRQVDMLNATPALIAPNAVVNETRTNG